MAIHATSTTAPIVQPRLLRGGGTVPCRVLTTDELLDELAGHGDMPMVARQADAKPTALLPVPLSSLTSALAARRAIFGAVTVVDTDTPVQARALHFRRELHQALDYGFALLDALDLPPMALDVIDDAIATLDALDAPDEDREPSLGWTGHIYQTAFNIGLTSDLEHDTADCEPSLASPERHPAVPWSGHWTERYVGRGSQDRQTNWADGSRQDHEVDIADELHDGDGEDLEAEPDEPVLGATEEIDQTAWAESGDHDRELDATDCIERHKPRAHMEASIARRGDMVALTRRAETLRRGFAAPTPHSYRDNVTPIGPGMMLWSGPL